MIVLRQMETDFHESILRKQDNSFDLYESTAEYIESHISRRPIYFLGKCPSGPVINRFSVKKHMRDGIELCEVVRLGIDHKNSLVVK